MCRMQQWERNHLHELNDLTRSMMLEFLRSLFLIENLKIIFLWVRIFFHKNALFFINKLTKRFYLKQYLVDDSIYTNINYMIIVRVLPFDPDHQGTGLNPIREELASIFHKSLFCTIDFLLFFSKSIFSVISIS